MPKSKIKPEDNAANMGNKNLGSPGTNRQLDQNQGNRAKQLDPKQGGGTGIAPQHDESKKK